MINELDKVDTSELKIIKEEEFNLMLELIENGLWRNVNLSRALHVVEETIIKWKKHPKVQEAHRRAILKYARKRTDVDKILKELDMEVEPDINSLVQNNYFQLDDEQLNKLIRSKINQVGVSPALRGETAPDAGEPAGVRESAPETN